VTKTRTYQEWLSSQVGRLVVVHTRSTQCALTPEGLAESFSGFLHLVFEDAVVIMSKDRDGDERYTSCPLVNVCGIAEVTTDQLAPPPSQGPAPCCGTSPPTETDSVS
jgi:hypothetical protein